MRRWIGTAGVVGAAVTYSKSPREGQGPQLPGEPIAPHRHPGNRRTCASRANTGAPGHTLSQPGAARSDCATGSPLIRQRLTTSARCPSSSHRRTMLRHPGALDRAEHHARQCRARRGVEQCHEHVSAQKRQAHDRGELMVCVQIATGLPRLIPVRSSATTLASRHQAKVFCPGLNLPHLTSARRWSGSLKRAEMPATSTRSKRNSALRERRTDRALPKISATKMPAPIRITEATCRLNWVVPVSTHSPSRIQ